MPWLPCSNAPIPPRNHSADDQDNLYREDAEKPSGIVGPMIHRRTLARRSARFIARAITRRRHFSRSLGANQHLGVIPHRI